MKIYVKILMLAQVILICGGIYLLTEREIAAGILVIAVNAIWFCVISVKANPYK